MSEINQKLLSLAAQSTVRWINHHLSATGKKIESLNSFDDGETLLLLMKTLFQTDLSSSSSSSSPPVQTSPQTSSSQQPNANQSTLPMPLSMAAGSSHKRATSSSSLQAATFVNLETIQQAFTVARDAGVTFKFIRFLFKRFFFAPLIAKTLKKYKEYICTFAEDFVEHNTKMVLAFLFAVALRYNLRGSPKSTIGPTDSTQEALLGWVRTRIATPPYTLNVSDFGSSWIDGKAFLALIHSVEPGMKPWNELLNEVSNDVESTLEKAFKMTSQIIGLAPLLDVATDLDSKGPNTQGIATYVSEMCRLIRLHEAKRQKQLQTPQKQSGISEEEYIRIKKELESTKRRVGELETELEATKASFARTLPPPSKRKPQDDDDDDDDESSDEEENEKGVAKTTGNNLSTTRAEDETLRRMSETHSNEHKKVQKTREQLRRAIERVEELADAARDDKDVVDNLPEELGWLLDVIQQKEQEVASAAAVMVQLEQQMAAASAASPGSLNVTCPMSEQEKVEVDNLLREAADEEHRVLSNVEKVLGNISNDIKGKPIADEVEKLRKLAAIGAQRAQRALSISPSTFGATAPQRQNANQGPNGAELTHQISRTLPSPQSHSMGLTVVGPPPNMLRRSSDAVPPPPQPPKSVAPLPPVVDNGEKVNIPVVVEKLGELEQKLVEEPEHRSKIAMLKQKAKEGLKKVRAKIGNAMHISKKAEKRENDKQKQPTNPPPPPSTSTTPTAATSVAPIVAEMNEKINKMRNAIRQSIIELNPNSSVPKQSPSGEFDDTLISRLLLEVRNIKATLDQKSAAISALQSSLVDAQTKVWERVKQIRKH